MNARTHAQRQNVEAAPARGLLGGLGAARAGGRSGAPVPSVVPSIVHEVLGMSGQPLDKAVREDMSRRFGEDFSGVRVHANEKAARAASSIGARAFTANRNIVFGAREYAPGGGDGRRLLAHELTHVVQQGAGASPPRDVAPPNGPREREADAAAHRVAAGQAVTPVRASQGQAGALIQRDPAPATAPTGSAAWTSSEIKAIQTELKRLGLYTLTIDGGLGQSTDIGLVEAFGGDEWRQMDATTALSRLKAAKPVASGKRGEHEFRYGEMFKDGLLDMTLALGFDEGNHNIAALKSFDAAMTSHKFKEDRALAETLYKKGGRTIGKSDFGRFYARQDVLTYTPPAGAARKISAVVRLVASLDGSQGKEVAEAYKEGFVKSDVAYYSGHGRYGSGPDFDRNYRFSLLAADGSVERTIDDYDDLEKLMIAEGGKAGRDAWSQFLWRVDHNRINVIASNQGNAVFNAQKLHQGEFGGKLMYWNLNRGAGKGATPITGETGELATKAAAAPERKYRVAVFDGCRSIDYQKSLRSTPRFDAKSADMLGSSRELEWSDEGRTLVEFLDGIIAMQSAEEIVRNMDAQQYVTHPVTKVRTQVKGAYHGFGIDDNPVVK